YKRPRYEEESDPWLVERHQRDIFPLLHRREQFAQVDEFRFYDFVREDGTVNEDVIAYSNRAGSAASLGAYHNRDAQTVGRVELSVASAQPAGGTERRSLFEGLGLQGGEDRFLVFRVQGTGLEHLVRSELVRQRGLELTLGAYGCTVL